MCRSRDIAPIGPMQLTWLTGSRLKHEACTRRIGAISGRVCTRRKRAPSTIIAKVPVAFDLPA